VKKADGKGFDKPSYGSVCLKKEFCSQCENFHCCISYLESLLFQKIHFFVSRVPRTNFGQLFTKEEIQVMWQLSIGKRVIIKVCKP